MRPRPRQTNLALKRHRILNELFRRGRAGRLELARRLNMNPAMVGMYIEEFVRRGLVLETRGMPVGRGRAPVPLGLNPAHGCFLGLDFEALRARVVVTDFSGELLFKKEHPFAAGIGREAVLEQIVALALEAATHAQGRLLQVGIAAPGQVDVHSGHILRYALLDDFCGVPLRERFQAHFDAPVFIEDNIRALTFAELLRGAGRECNNFLCMAVRSGVGLGIVMNGELYHGVNAMAGELGYAVFPWNGGVETLTELISAVGLTRRSGAFASFAQLLEAAEAGDSRAAALLDELGNLLGMTAANLANVFAPEKIVLVGEVPQCSLRVRQKMERVFRTHTLAHILQNVYLQDGALSGFAGALGAAYLGFKQLFPVDDAACLKQIRAMGPDSGTE